MKKTLRRVVALTAVIAFTTANVSFAAGGAVGHGDISVHKQGQVTTKLTGRNPIEDGAMLVCDGKCMVKSEGLSVIAEDQSQIAVVNEADTFKLYVKEGSVDYVINSNARKIAFYTPKGIYTVAEAVFNASDGAAIKGSVLVDESGVTEITVTEGKMVFTTADGMKTVDANNKLVLAAAPNDPPTDDDGLWWQANGLFVIGGAAILALGIAAANSDDDDDNIVPVAPETDDGVVQTGRDRDDAASPSM